MRLLRFHRAARACSCVRTARAAGSAAVLPPAHQRAPPDRLYCTTEASINRSPEGGTGQPLPARPRLRATRARAHAPAAGRGSGSNRRCHTPSFSDSSHSWVGVGAWVGGTVGRWVKQQLGSAGSTSAGRHRPMRAPARLSPAPPAPARPRSAAPCLPGGPRPPTCGAGLPALKSSQRPTEARCTGWLCGRWAGRRAGERRGTEREGGEA